MSAVAEDGLKKRITNVWKLSIPAILTQIATIVMQYIDSAMVGTLGANASASIGLVSTSTWLVGGIITALSIGFSVQIAHSFGAGEYKEGRKILRHGLVYNLIISIILMILCSLVANHLGPWLGAEETIWDDAGIYFLVFSLTIPFMLINTYCASCLQCSGNMIIPSILNAIMCLLDIVFNAIFIPKYQVLGAAIGTSLATIVVAILMFYFCCFQNKKLKITNKDYTVFNFEIIKKSIKIGVPIAIEQVTRSLAMIVSTRIVAPLGNIAIAANSFAVTAESICYMPGFGVGSAATTLVGQEMGAGNNKKAKSYGNISIAFGTIIMTFTALLMFIICPFVFKFLTPDQEVRELAIVILRIGMIAEPLYGVSIVATGALRGAEDTLVPSILNLLSIWVIRITLSFILVKELGLMGVWIANTIELCVRGIVLLIRQKTSRHYFRKKFVQEVS